MNPLKNVTDKIRDAVSKPGPRLLTVTKAWHLTPNMIRVTLSGPELEGFPEGREGGNCKLMLPEPSETRDEFAERLSSGPAPVRRTFTVRHYRADVNELDLDFVSHGDNGPASRWAGHAEAGNFLGFMGASKPKVTHFEADWYLIAADPSAIPLAAATLEAMPRDAKGVAVFEVTSAEDRQTIQAPDGVEMIWLVHPDPQIASTQQEEFIRKLDWPSGRVQVCAAGESSAIKGIRTYVLKEKDVAREDLYASGYWKIGMLEDEHQKFKSAESES